MREISDTAQAALVDNMNKVAGDLRDKLTAKFPNHSIVLFETKKYFNDSTIRIADPFADGHNLVDVDVFAEQSGGMWDRHPTGGLRVRVTECGKEKKFTFPQLKDKSFNWDKILEQVRRSVDRRMLEAKASAEAKVARDGNAPVAMAINDRLNIPFSDVFAGMAGVPEYRTYNQPHADVNRGGAIVIHGIDNLNLTAAEAEELLTVVTKIYNNHHPKVPEKYRIDHSNCEKCDTTPNSPGCDGCLTDYSKNHVQKKSSDLICEKCGNTNDDNIVNGECSKCRGTENDLVEEIQ